MREEPLSRHEVESVVRQALAEFPLWEEARSRHRYPVTEPLPLAVALLAEAVACNVNNAGAQLGPSSRLKGTRRLERQVVEDVATLLHDSDADGWLTTGGTEGNLTGLWLARDRLRDRGLPPVFASTAVHESVAKASRVLGLDLKSIPASERGTLKPEHLAAALDQHRRMGGRTAIIVGTVGTTLAGTCDDISALCTTVPDGVEAHVHVDAAFAGLVLPFTDPRRWFDFRNPTVQSMVVDLHKAARAPLGMGVFLARPGSTHILRSPRTYSRVDDRVLLGSRPGYVAAAAWAALNGQGRREFRDDLQRCLQLKREFLRLVEPHRRVIHDWAVNAAGVLRAEASGFEEVHQVYFMPHAEVSAIAREVLLA